jgi:hypothetical protein
MLRNGQRVSQTLVGSTQLAPTTPALAWYQLAEFLTILTGRTRLEAIGKLWNRRQSARSRRFLPGLYPILGLGNSQFFPV